MRLNGKEVIVIYLMSNPKDLNRKLASNITGLKMYL